MGSRSASRLHVLSPFLRAACLSLIVPYFCSKVVLKHSGGLSTTKWFSFGRSRRGTREIQGGLIPSCMLVATARKLLPCASSLGQRRFLISHDGERNRAGGGETNRVLEIRSSDVLISN